MGKLFVVGTPIGNIEDLSFRARRILQEVNLIAAEDTRRTGILLRYYEINTFMTAYHKFNFKKRTPEIISFLKKGKTVALVSDAGMPGISDPGYELIKSAIEEGIEVIPIPGPTALITALSISGISSDRFCFEGFLPKEKAKRIEKLKSLKDEDRTIIIYEAPHRLLETLEDILGCLGNRRIAVSRELTKKFEETIRGNVFEVIKHFKEKKPIGEFVIVIEGAKEKTLDKDKALEFAKELVKAKVSKNIAARIASKFFGVSKNIIYKEIL